jgi:FHS family glucose/mannose:H+ symporter-like MFS transporter
LRNKQKRGNEKMNKRLLNITSYLGYFFVGIVTVILSPSLPFMIRDFNITLAAAGAAFTSRSAGSFFGVLLGGFLSDKLGRKPLIIIGALVQGIALAVIGSTGSWYMVLLFFIINGIASGFFNASVNTLVAEINIERRGAAMNVLHGVYGLGSLIGPMAIGLVLTWQFGWRLVFYGAGTLWFLFLLLAIGLPFPDPKEKRVDQQQPLPLKSFLIHPILITLFFVSFFYNGAATGLVGWINTYMEQMQFSTILGSSMVTVFYIGLTTGRFLCGIFSDRLGFSRTILICSIGSLLFYPLAVFTSQPILIAAGVILSGFFFSGLHPTGLAYANRLFPDSAGTVTGMLSTAMTLGAMILPWLIGLIADYSGFRAGLGLAFASLFILVAIAVRLVYIEQKTDHTLK